jgi:hypothetical protein
MKSPIKVAAWSYIILVALMIMQIALPLVFKIFNLNLVILSIVYGIIYFALLILVYNGFIVIGKKYNNNFIVIVSYVAIVLLALDFVVSTGFTLFIRDLNYNTFDLSYIGYYLGYAIYKITLMIVRFAIIPILFGVALLGLSKDVSMARATGILNIVAGATVIILVGFLVYIAVIVLEIILLFMEASKPDKTDGRTKLGRS